MKIFSLLWVGASLIAAYKTIKWVVEHPSEYFTTFLLAGVTALCIFLAFLKLKYSKMLAKQEEKFKQNHQKTESEQNSNS